MNRNHNPALPEFQIPKITKAERATGFRDCNVTFLDGSTKLMRVFRPEPVRMVQILNSDSMTERVYSTVAHSLRESISFASNIRDSSIVEIFLTANGLASEEVFIKALSACGEIGQAMICENLPGYPGKN